MPLTIEKEKIPSLSLVPVINDQSEKWFGELQYALRLGNEYKGKTTIIFETSEGGFSGTTTVWLVTKNHLQLKGGITIPLVCISGIHFH